jgi:hypothetical protein
MSTAVGRARCGKLAEHEIDQAADIYQVRRHQGFVVNFAGEHPLKLGYHVE